MGTITKESFYPFELSKVKAIHDDPHRWHEWIDGAQGPGEVRGNGSVGTTCLLILRAGGLTQPYSFEVMESTIGDTEGRWVGKVTAPNLRVRESRAYTADGSGTREVWTFEYEPVGLVGFLLRPFLKRIVTGTMERTARNFQAFCAEAASR